MTWAFRRQVFYIFAFILLLALFGYGAAYPSINQAPTCTDGKQNGIETGIDCGGSCAFACTSQVDQISVLWARSFRVTPGRYNAVAYVENHNQNAAITSIHYRFRFADENNIYVGKREGVTFIPPGGKFAIFEPAIGIGNSIPVYTTFEFTEAPRWAQVSKDKIIQSRISVSNIELMDESTHPLASATLKNNSLYSVPELNVVIILYDNSGNAVSASRTYLGELPGGSEKEINFTWPEPFSRAVFVKEIIPMYDFWSH